MTDQTADEAAPADDILFSWSRSYITAFPIKTIGIVLNIVFRILFGLFFFLAGFNKLQKDWLVSDILQVMFWQRLTELDPLSFAYTYLTEFALPIYPVIAWIVVWGELAVGIGLLLGLFTRLASFGGFFILFNLAIGGYYDASLLPFFILNLIFIKWPSGHWLGVDGKLRAKYPKYGWLMS